VGLRLRNCYALFDATTPRFLTTARAHRLLLILRDAAHTHLRLRYSLHVTPNLHLGSRIRYAVRVACLLLSRFFCAFCDYATGLPYTPARILHACFFRFAAFQFSYYFSAALLPAWAANNHQPTA